MRWLAAVLSAATVLVAVPGAEARPASGVEVIDTYDLHLLHAIEQAPPPTPMVTHKGFRSLLTRSIGYGAVQPRAAAKAVASEPVPGGTLTDLRIRYDSPPLAPRALELQHAARPDKIMLILHGHLSSADRVIGRVPAPDGEGSMRAIGKRYYDRGWDIIAFDLTRDGVASSRLNAYLTLWGTHIYGLWTRALCDTAASLHLRQRYRRVVVYGLSNGAWIADQLSVVCAPFSLIIVDDVIQDRRQALWGDDTAARWYQYIFHYLGPLISGSSPADFIANSRSPKVYTRHQSYLEDSGLEKALKTRFLFKPLTARASTRLVFKHTTVHAPEFDLLDAILAGRWSALDGAALVPRRG